MALPVNSERPQTHLLRPAADVAGELQHCITQGRDLLTELHLSSLPAPERLERFGGKYWDWHDDNAALLRRVFSTSEIEQSYAEIAIERGVGQLGFADLLRDLALGLQHDIAFLVRLHDQLRAYDAPLWQ
jgi:hypothetical protein